MNPFSTGPTAPTATGDLIAGDRRSDRRYELNLELRWKLVRRKRVVDTGTGTTLDLSSSGVLFEAGRHLPSGGNIELSISWPVLLHNTAPMQLVVTGRVVRVAGSRSAIRMTQHEFRTVRAGIESRAMAAAAQSAVPFSFSRSPISGKLQ